MKKSGMIYVHLIIAVILAIVIRLLVHPEGSLTDGGIWALAIALPVIYLWITVDTFWPSLLLFLFVPLIGIYESFSEVCKASFGNTTIIFAISCIVFSSILVENGLVGRMSSFFVSRKLINGRPYVFLFMYFLAIAVLSNFIETVSLLIISCGFVQELTTKIKLREHNNYSNALNFGTLWIIAIVGVCNPIAKVLPMILMNFLPDNVSMSGWILYGLPIQILSFAVLVIVIRFIWKPVEKEGIENISLEHSYEKMDKNEKISLCVLILALAMWLMPFFVSDTFLPGVKNVLGMIGDSAPAIIGIVILCIIQVKEKPIADIPKALKSVPVGLVVFISAIFLISDMISLETTGITKYLYDGLASMTNMIPPYLIFIILLVLAVVMTNLTSNIVTAVLFMQLAIPLFSNENYPPVVVALLIGTAACMAVLTPSASVPASILFGMNKVDIKDIWKYAFLIVVITLAGVIALSYPMMNIV